jgi:hypothetical protein
VVGEREGELGADFSYVSLPRNDNQAAMPRQYARMGLFIAFLVV